MTFNILRNCDRWIQNRSYLRRCPKLGRAARKFVVHVRVRELQVRVVTARPAGLLLLVLGYIVFELGHTLTVVILVRITETKQPRDLCIVMKGQEKCKSEILAHNQCLRADGFDIK
jgi:hypothetical protein